MEKFVKDIVSNHFDKKVENPEWKNLEIYGSESVNYYLQYPYRYTEELIDKFDNKNIKILDYCCGTGIYSIYPLLKGHHVSGMDFSSKSIEIAQKKIKHFNLSKLSSFAVMDAEHLQYSDNSFDLILAYGSLSYLTMSTSYKELNRVLKPKGKIVIIDSLGHNPLFKINRSKNINSWAKGINNHVKTLTIDDIKLGGNYLELKSIIFFDLFTVLGAFMFKSQRISFVRKFLRALDKIILFIPLIRLFAFKFVAIYESKKK